VPWHALPDDVAAHEGDVDDETGWNAILVEGWGALVRAAVCDRVADLLDTSRGLLTIAVTTPDDAPAAAVERVHDAVLVAIATETGANLDELGSQAAWATYDDVWAELGRRWDDATVLEFVPAVRADTVLDLLRQLPPQASNTPGPSSTVATSGSYAWPVASASTSRGSFAGSPRTRRRSQVRARTHDGSSKSPGARCEPCRTPPPPPPPPPSRRQSTCGSGRPT
jgi:hypothetical protein